jgi:hypothetical protein
VLAREVNVHQGQGHESAAGILGGGVMNRRRDDLQNIDTSMWPCVDVNALASEQKAAFIKYKKAVELAFVANALPGPASDFDCSPMPM